jgi:hypothetical protein
VKFGPVAVRVRVRVRVRAGYRYRPAYRAELFGILDRLIVDLPRLVLDIGASDGARTGRSQTEQGTRPNVM